MGKSKCLEYYMDSSKYNYEEIQKSIDETKKEYVNKNYVNNATVAQNYKVGTGYDNEKAAMNTAEVDLRNWLQTYLLSMARTADSQRFLNKGYVPARAKEGVHDAWFWAKEAGKWIGVVEGANGRETFDQDSDVSYEQDFATPMPMTYLLQEKDTEIKDNPAPIRREDESLEDYENRMKEWQKEKDENEKARRESHKNIIDNNWEDSIAEFIEKAGHYNAVQDNKNLMFYGLNMIKKIENCSLTIIAEREELLDTFNSKVQILDSDNVVITEKITKHYAANPRLFEGETLSLSIDKAGKANIFVKKFDPKNSVTFLETLYCDLQQCMICLANHGKEE